MNECDICLTKIKKRGNKRHEQSKKHKYYPNLVINKYIVKNPESNKFKDIIQEYYDKRKTKFNNFVVCVRWKKIELIINKLFVPDDVYMRRGFMLKGLSFFLIWLLEECRYVIFWINTMKIINI